ncbi:MAG TPA: hypothetical protein VF676_04725 [Flavobacterium sp.]|jgi:hypothetical protein
MLKSSKLPNAKNIKANSDILRRLSKSSSSFCTRTNTFFAIRRRSLGGIESVEAIAMLSEISSFDDWEITPVLASCEQLTSIKDKKAIIM